MLWIKALHIIFMVTWFAGLFYLPRLFVYHAMAEDAASRERFKIMERKLYWGIMAPGAVLTLVFGTWLWLGYGFTGAWLYAKLGVVVLLGRSGRGEAVLAAHRFGRPHRRAAGRAAWISPFSTIC